MHYRIGSCQLPPLHYRLAASYTDATMNSKLLKLKGPSTIKMTNTLLRLGWSQVALASVCGTSQATISRVANGEYEDVPYSVGKRLEYLHNHGVKPSH